MRTLSRVLLTLALLTAPILPSSAPAQELSYQETRQLGLAKKDLKRWTYALDNEPADAFSDPAKVEEYGDLLARAAEHVAWFPNKEHPDVKAFVAEAMAFEQAINARISAAGGTRSDADRTLLEAVDKKLVQLAYDVEETDDATFSSESFATKVDDLLLQLHYDFMSFEAADHPSVAERKAEYARLKQASEERRAARDAVTAELGGEPTERLQQLKDKWYAIPFPIKNDPSVERIDTWSEQMAHLVATRESDKAVLDAIEAAGVDEKTKQSIGSMRNNLDWDFKSKLEQNTESTCRYVDFLAEQGTEAPEWFAQQDVNTPAGQRWFVEPARYGDRVENMQRAVALMPAIVRMDERMGRTDTPDRGRQLATAEQGLVDFAKKQKEALDKIRMPAHNGDGSALAVAEKILAAEVERGAATAPARIVILGTESDKKTTWETDRGKVMQVNWAWTDIFAMTAEPQEDGSYQLYHYRIRKWDSGYAVTLGEWRRSERGSRGPILKENLHK